MKYTAITKFFFPRCDLSSSLWKLFIDRLLPHNGALWLIWCFVWMMQNWTRCFALLPSSNSYLSGHIHVKLDGTCSHVVYNIVGYIIGWNFVLVSFSITKSHVSLKSMFRWCGFPYSKCKELHDPRYILILINYIRSIDHDIIICT